MLDRADWIGLIDLTRLEERVGDDREVVDLCRRAVTSRGHVAAVCVYPEYVSAAHDLLRGTSVAVATVANFPDGDAPIPKVLEEVAAALHEGASEIDVVVPYRAWLKGETGVVMGLLDRVADLCAGRALVKAIMETGMIASSLDRRALARLCARPGVAFLKTSTGKAAVGATVEGVQDLVDVVKELLGEGRPIGLKIAGGVRTFEQLSVYAALIETRLGAGFFQSSTLRIGASVLLGDLLRESSDGRA